MTNSLLESLSAVYYNLILLDLRQANLAPIEPVSYNTALYLDLISLKEPCTISSLAKELHLSKPAVTMKVSSLVQKGLVIKTQSLTDKRVFYLSVSTEVQKTNERYDRPLYRAVQQMEKLLNPDELAQFCRYLELFGDQLLEDSHA